MISENIKNLKDRYRNRSGEKIGRDLIEPCLKECILYRRGTGFFSSSAFKSYIGALEHLISNDTKIEILCSPKIDKGLYETLKNCHDEKGRDDVIQERVNNIAKIAAGVKSNPNDRDWRSLLIAYLISTKKLEIKFAQTRYFKDIIITEALDDDIEPDMNNINDRAMYHIKYGYFEFDDGSKVVFDGSVNETDTALNMSTESANVFKSWQKGFEEWGVPIISEVDDDWDGKNNDIKLYEVDSDTLRLIEQQSQQYTGGKRPKNTSKDQKKPIPNPVNPTPAPVIDSARKYRHQAEAIKVFLKEKVGILNMATGTGKTRTALKIINQLSEEKKIDSFIVTCYGTDLLNQWHGVLLEPDEIVAENVIEKFPAIYLRKPDEFSINPKESGLLVSIDSLGKALQKIPQEQLNRTLLIFDEVHNLGTPKKIDELTSQLKKLTYRLGLSATPDKGKFNKEMTKAIESAFGGKKPIFDFTVEDAIKRGILCEFKYIPLNYVLSDEDREQFQKINATKTFRAEQGNPMSDEEIAMKLSRVYKLNENKLQAFEEYLSNDKSILKSTIIFVQEEAYGEKVLHILNQHTSNYKTYYGDENPAILKSFANEEIDILVTCNAISQGIDIPKLENIVLFSSNKVSKNKETGEREGGGETVQRLGRCLRNPASVTKKIAKVIDFCQVPEDESKESYDEDRKNWLTELSKTRFIKDE